MPPAELRPRDRKWRRYFRRCRIVLLLVALALVGALLYLNQIGLPEFLRQPLLEKLRARGVDLRLSTLRLNFYRGIVAEAVNAGRTGDAASVRFTASEADVKLSLPALARLQLVLTGVGLHDGRLTFPAPATNQPGRILTIEKIRVDLRFLPDDAWALEDFHAVFGGADFSLTGIITNATAVPQLPFWRGESVPRSDLIERRLGRLADTLEKVHFTAPPEIRCRLSGDARDPEKLALRLTVTAPVADTPWGRLTNGVFTGRLLPAVTVTRPHAELHLHASSAQTPWADIARLNLDLSLQASAVDTNLVNASLTLAADSANTRWASVTNARLTIDWLHALTDPIPLSGHARLQAEAAASSRASARGLELTADLATPFQPPPADASWAWWQSLQPYALGWSARAARLDLEKIGAEDVACGGNWRAPLLQITNLYARFPEGRFAAHGKLDVATRAADFELQSNFNVHRLGPVLSEEANRWLARYTWDSPPQLAGSGAAVLPAWTNRSPDWFDDLLSSLRLAGQVAITNGTYLGVPADWATLHLSLTNQVWRLPDLVACRPEGQLQLVHIADDKTHDYYFGFHSTIDVRVLRPLLAPDQQSGFDLLTFTQPPVIDAEVRGRWRDNNLIGFDGRVALADFTFREQTATRFESALHFTNGVLQLLQPRLERGPQVARADGITADFNAQRIYFTNGFSTAEPLVIARGIGPNTARAIEPYRFTQPPVVRVNGYVPLQGDEDTDLRFDVDGGPFEWQKFKIPHITGQVHWRGDSLRLTNVQLRAYDGAAAGFANFDFRPATGTDFQFNLGVTNVDLRLLLGDISTHTNYLEGRLNGELVITNANTADKFSWNGHGQLHLKDGLIWEIPVFGVLSKPLDRVVPGLGSARIKEGAGPFSITNGVIFSDTIELRAPTSRLLCHGTVDFAGAVNARVAVVLLRDPLGLSRILSLALWPVTKLFEYQVIGTLDAPKADPAFLPSKLLLHPFRTVEEILTGEAFTAEAGKTNAPPAFKEVP